MARRSTARRDTYAPYDGGPDPLAPPVDLAEALDAIGQDVMAGYSPERAMREFLRRGGQDRTGLDDLARRVAEKRRELTARHNLDGTLQEVRELLDRAVLNERKQLARDVEMDDADRAFREMQLDNLPAVDRGRGQRAGDYDWQSREAREDYERIKDLLGRELLDQRFAGMKQALENATDEDREAINEMLTDLNELLDKHARGEDTDEDFEEFMAKHGEFFPENPQNVDELIDALAQRAAAAQRMLNSMSREQREELMGLSQQAFGSPALMQQLAQLDANLQALRPGEDWSGSERFDGEEGLGLGDGTGVLQDLADLDDLADQLAQSYDGARMDDLDLDKLARQLGHDAAVDARTLQRLEQALRDSGYLQRTSDGQLKLSPKAMRQLGRALLRDVATRMSGRQGQRDVRTSGAAGERSGATRPWEFGDTEPWDVTRTVTNAVQRDVVARRRRPAAAGVTPAHRRRRGDGDRGAHAGRVALLVDTSFSMAMDGRWVPMKRTALALHTLIRSRFRGDALQLITFGRYAQTMDIEELTALDARWDKGTNLHHGLLLANRHFRKHPNAQPVLLVVTDGEPTSHLEPGGEVYFEYPPHPLTVAYAVRELDNAGRLGAQTTFFRLGDDPGLARFVDSMARRVDGRVVAPELDDLGAAVVGLLPRLARTGRVGVRPLRRLVRRPRVLGRQLSRHSDSSAPPSGGIRHTATNRSSGREAGQRLLEDRPERRLRLELAEHADAAEPGAVDEQVRRRQVELGRDGEGRLARVVDALELLAHPLAREAEPLHPGRLDEGGQVVEDRLRVDLDPLLDEALAAQAVQQGVGVLVDGEPHQAAHRGRQRRSGSRATAPKSSTPEPARAAVRGRAASGSCPGAGRRGASRCAPGRRRGSAPAARRSGRARLRAGADHRRQRGGRLQPLADQHGLAEGDDVGHHDVGIARKASANAGCASASSGSRARRPPAPGPPRPAA